jgi:ketosteroid isomerase-like protein
LRTRWVPLLLLVIATACARPVGAQTPGENGTAVARVMDLEATRRAAMVAGDMKSLAELMADDVTYVHSNGMIQKRDELFSMLTRGEIRYVSFNVDAVEFRAYGDTVVGTGTQLIDLTSAGKPFTSRSRFTVVYAPVGGALKVVAYQSTPLPEITPGTRQ